MFVSVALKKSLSSLSVSLYGTHILPFLDEDLKDDHVDKFTHSDHAGSKK